jgi:anaerobic magnesium-protoporphyrin IX monomethyl ester cyclase
MEKNKVMFINAPQSSNMGTTFTNLKFPLGFLYMASELEKRGFEVKILDCPVHYWKSRVINDHTVRIGLLPEDIKEEIKKFSPDIVGVTCAYTAYEHDAFETIDFVSEVEEELGKKMLVVVGGAHTSANSKHVLRNEKIDVAVIGEGEDTIAELAEKYRAGEDYSNVTGTSMIVNGKFKLNDTRPYIQDLDRLSPAWHLIDMNLYFNHPDNHQVTLRGPAVDIITSRGCPMTCVFCSIHTVWGRKWRGASAKHVVDEIEHLVTKYGVKQIRIQDDNLTVNRKRTIEICDEIVNRGIDIKWDTPNGVAYWTLNEEMLEKMNKSGCYRITFGIETASEKTQKYVGKMADVTKIKELIRLCHKHNMWVCSTFIIGFPYETKQDINETKYFITDTSTINFPFVYVAQPYQGTDMYYDFKKEDLLGEFQIESNVGRTKYGSKYFTHEELNKIRTGIYVRFYLKKILDFTNPYKLYREFLSKLRGTEDLKYVFKNTSSILSGIRNPFFMDNFYTRMEKSTTN